MHEEKWERRPLVQMCAWAHPVRARVNEALYDEFERHDTFGGVGNFGLRGVMEEWLVPCPPGPGEGYVWMWEVCWDMWDGSGLFESLEIVWGERFGVIPECGVSVIRWNFMKDMTGWIIDAGHMWGWLVAYRDWEEGGRALVVWKDADALQSRRGTGRS